MLRSQVSDPGGDTAKSYQQKEQVSGVRVPLFVDRPRGARPPIILLILAMPRR